MKARALVLVLILGLLIGQVNGAYESQTLHITDTEDDGFISESGNMFDTASLIYTTEASQDVRSFWVFDDVDIESSEKLNNATLRIRSGSSRDFDADNSFTLKGLELSDLQDSWRPLAGMIIILPQTSAYVNVNTSNWYGSQWHEIDVTNIVKEIVNHVAWDGDASGSGDSIGFIGLGVQDETRGFYDYSGSSAYSAQLIINFGDPPSVPPVLPPAYQNDTWTFTNTTERVVVNETSGETEDIEIWEVIDYGDPELLVVSSNNLIYFNSTKGDPNYENWATDTFTFQSPGAVEFIATLGGWTFLVGRNNTEVEIFYSDDEFQTWRVDAVNDHYPKLTGQASDFGSVWPDQTGAGALHLVWGSRSTWENGAYNIFYTNFTLDPVTLNLTWASTYDNVSIDQTTNQINADLYQEKDGTIHVAWNGLNGTVEEQIQYRRRQANGTWLNAVRLSGLDAWDCREPDVVANEATGLALVVWTRYDVTADIQYDFIFPNNTVGTVVGNDDRTISSRRYPSVVNDRDTEVAHMAYSQSLDPTIEYRNMSITNSSTWSAEADVSPHAQGFFYPVIALDEANDTLAIVWWNDWNTQTAYEVFQIATGPTQGKELLLALELRYPSMADYFSRVINASTWWLVWGNGTIIDGPFDSLDDALEGLDDLIGSDPDEPDPPGQDYPQTGPFTRFKTRLYILILGLGCVLGPLFFLAMKYDSGISGGNIAGVFIVMLIGLGLMLAIRQI